MSRRINKKTFPPPAKASSNEPARPAPADLAPGCDPAETILSLHNQAAFLRSAYLSVLQLTAYCDAELEIALDALSKNGDRSAGVADAFDAVQAARRLLSDISCLGVQDFETAREMHPGATDDAMIDAALLLVPLTAPAVETFKAHPVPALTDLADRAALVVSQLNSTDQSDPKETL